MLSTYKNGRGRQNRPGAFCFLRSKWGRRTPPMSWCEHSKELGFGKFEKRVARSLVTNQSAPQLKCGGRNLTNVLASELLPTHLCLAVVMGQRHNLGTFRKEFGASAPMT